MIQITVASWNIEKSGQASTLEKQSKVSHFIDECCVRLNINVVFLCEVHSARVQDYLEFLQTVYVNYTVDYLEGGYSNNYIIMVRKDFQSIISHFSLEYLNRGGIVVNFVTLVDPEVITCSLALGHFKSGQSDLTKRQLVAMSEFLQSMTADRWAIVGDLNWSFSKVLELPIVGAIAVSCWNGPTQVRGSELDWCLMSNSQYISALAVDLTAEFPTEIYDMQGPDHKPVIYQLSYN